MCESRQTPWLCAPHKVWLCAPQSALAQRARALLLVFEKFTRACLFQIALEKKSIGNQMISNHVITYTNRNIYLFG